MGKIQKTKIMTPEFKPFPKMARLSREIIVTEKIDGTNASIYIIKPEVDVSNFSGWIAHVDGLLIWAGSRTRWITPEEDNHGFAKWALEHALELADLGPGMHFGEWWGSGIQRGYGLTKGEKRFSLFNVQRWTLHGTEPQQIPTADPRVVKMQDVLPACCGLVPILYRGDFDTAFVNSTLTMLAAGGSVAAPGFMNPEGIVVYHTAGNFGLKKTIHKDSEPKSLRS